MEEERERTSMDQDLDTPEDPLLRREEGSAAAEAGSIGGDDPDYEGDEAARPLEEGGEGEAEGFELSERDLGETASHGEGRYSPEADEFAPEEESDRADAVHGASPTRSTPPRWSATRARARTTPARARAWPPTAEEGSDPLSRSDSRGLTP